MKTYQHIIFWIIVIIGLTLVFGDWFQSYSEAFYYVCLLLPIVMGTSYFFNYYLVPKYLFARRFILFGLYSLYMVIVSLCLEIIASILAMLLMIRFQVNETSPLVNDVFLLAFILYFIVFVKSFILLVKHYFIDQRAIQDLEMKQMKLEKGFFTVTSRRQTSRIQFNEVLYIESLSDYVKIHTEDGREIVTKQKISGLEKELPDIFLRIHRSFLINTEKATSFSREIVKIGELELPVGRSYKTNVIASLGK